MLCICLVVYTPLPWQQDILALHRTITCIAINVSVLFQSKATICMHADCRQIIMRPRVWYVLSATIYYWTHDLPNRQTNQLKLPQHEFVVQEILSQIIAKLEESVSSFPGERP